MTEDIYSSLTISEEEARNGTARSLALPDGNKIMVAVPAGVFDGQVLRIAGVVTPASESGRAGTLILTLHILSGGPTQLATNAEETERTAHASSPGNSGQFPPAQAVTPPPIYASGSNWPAQSPQNARVLPVQRNISTTIMQVLILVVLVVLLAGSLGGIFVLTRYTNAIAQSQATATALVNDSTATSAVNATAMPQYAAATALATASSSIPDPYGAGGKLIVNDPLQSNKVGSSWFWQEDSHCVFTSGGYHVIDTSSKFIQDCDLDTISQLTNYAVEFKMAILRGDVGGILFRDDPIFQRQDLAYMLVFDTKGNYQLLYYTSLNQSPNRLTLGKSSAFHTGYNQVNTIGVVANGSTITWYANGQQVSSRSDSKYNEGGIRLTTWLYTGDSGNSETAFSDLRIWAL